MLCKFPIEFLSNLSFIFKKYTYAIDENIIIEGDKGKELYFMGSGKVVVLHRKSRTLIFELQKDQYFGEISFFLMTLRRCTIKARDFTDVLILDRDNFL